MFESLAAINMVTPTECRAAADDQVSSAFRARPGNFLMEGIDRFQLAGLALICLKNETKADDLSSLMQQ